MGIVFFIVIANFLVFGIAYEYLVFMRTMLELLNWFDGFDSWGDIHTSRMTLADDVNLEEFAMTKDEFSGADIKVICTEAGLLALRERRMKVTHADFKKAKEKVMFKKQEGVPEGLYM
ncbi:unnamed protein product [Musa hybrid cultivar]